ncbi:MAG: helix-turn-helix domain-containing protein [Clostridia bacterium]|nr:helix-turn-helix domain-containing protein [Clostridia bacterium]
MSEKIDLKYLCANLGNLSGMPVRLYDGDDLSFYYSIVSLPTDPFLSCKKEVFEINDHVGYFVTPHDNYYGVVNFSGKRLVVGPTRQIPLSEQELHEIAFEINVPIADVPDFIAGMKSIVPMPLMSVLQMLCIVNHVLNDGETLSLSDISIVEPEQENLIETLGAEAVERAISSADGFAEQSFLHNSSDVEEYMLGAVRKGDVEGLKDFFKNVPAIRSGILAQNGLRQAKNLFVVTATLVSRSAIRGGMDAEDALTLSDGYIQKCELLTSVEAVTNLNYRLVIDYAERMERLLHGGHSSKLVVEVNNYIRHHLSEPITVEALAKHLCRGRSRLSTDFKKETGENLSEFILKQKIEEGKRFLRYTDKTSVDISFYLGFSSQSHFSRTFKKYVGLTPNEYRSAKRRR